MRFLILIILLAFIAQAFPINAAETPPREVTDGFLASLRAEVAANHPSALGAAERVAAAQAAIGAIRLWEDPMVGLGYMTGDEELMMDDGDLGVGIEVPLPRFGLVNARRAKARAEVSLAESTREQVAIQLQRTAALSAIEMALFDDLLAIETVELQWLEQMTSSALEKAKDPMANASEVLRFESELARQQQKLETYRRQRQQLAEQINIILGRKHGTSWALLRLLAESRAVPSAELTRRGLNGNPEVRKAKAGSEIAERDLAIARAESGPVMAVTADSSFYSGSGYRQTTVGVQISLPWFNEPSYRAGRESAARAAGAANREVEGTLRDVEFEAVAARVQAVSAFQSARRFQQEIIPKMMKAMESTQAAWVSSRATVIDVLDARRSLLAAKVEEKRALAEGMAALENLRALSPTAFATK